MLHAWLCLSCSGGMKDLPEDPCRCEDLGATGRKEFWVRGSTIQSSAPPSATAGREAGRRRPGRPVTGGPRALGDGEAMSQPGPLPAGRLALGAAGYQCQRLKGMN